MIEHATESSGTINPHAAMTRTNSIRRTGNHFSSSTQKSVQHPALHQGLKANQNIFMSRMANAGLQHIQNSGTKAKVAGAGGLPPTYSMGIADQHASQSI